MKSQSDEILTDEIAEAVNRVQRVKSKQAWMKSRCDEILADEVAKAVKENELLLCNMNCTFGAFNRLSEARGDFGTVFDEFYIGHFANAGFYLAVGVYKFR